tara:strand:- start:334 stop:504 length:171 start_codon:yes stop_codon:yes gene_type:complete
MLSIDECYAVLNRSKKKYTKQQVNVIREQLYQFAKIIEGVKPLEGEKFKLQKSNTI